MRKKKEHTNNSAPFQCFRTILELISILYYNSIHCFGRNTKQKKKETVREKEKNNIGHTQTFIFIVMMFVSGGL